MNLKKLVDLLKQNDINLILEIWNELDDYNGEFYNLKGEVLTYYIDNDKYEFFCYMLNLVENINQIQSFCQGSIAAYAINRSKYNYFESIFNVGGRCTIEDINDFSQDGKNYYFEFMHNHQSNLSEIEIDEFKTLRWEIITKKVWVDKWSKAIFFNNTDAYLEKEQNPESFSYEDRIYNLYFSILYDNTDILEILLNNLKTNPNILLKSKSPLCLAESLNHTDCIEILQNYGAQLFDHEKEEIERDQYDSESFDIGFTSEFEEDLQPTGNISDLLEREIHAKEGEL